MSGFGAPWGMLSPAVDGDLVYSYGVFRDLRILLALGLLLYHEGKSCLSTETRSTALYP